MKKAYLAISLSKRKKFKKEIEAIKNCLQEKNITTMVFVDHYHFKKGEEKEMMQTAFKEIDQSDILIAELSNKATGVSVEVGYAFARNKPIIYLKRKNAEYSTTVGGCANYLIEYSDEKDLKKQLIKILKSILGSN